VLQELAGELVRRKELFAGFADVDTLTAYNARADAPLAPVVLAIDEASQFLADGNVAEGIKTLARRGRKYGMWLVLGGQTFSSKDVSTSTSLQFSTRCQFRAPVVSSSQTLVGDKEARALECPGRAILVLPGAPPVKVQAPFVTHDDILAALAGGGPGRAMPKVIEETTEDDTDAKIRLLAGDGVSRTEIARQLFGSTGGAAFYRVKRALDFDTSTSTEGVEVSENAEGK
jgi:DNA segregation ATPase FtsK/SpoIIIE-like protein